MKRVLLLILGLAFASAGCQSMYNSAMEQIFGMEKRELLRNAVEAVNRDQKKAQTEFKDAMTELKELYAFRGGNLETMYNRFKGSYDSSRAQSDTVRKRIDNMERIAKSMFSEWAKEIKQYSNKEFAESSRAQLNATKARYAQLVQSVRESEKSMYPILIKLNDNVLYLKHNLNASAIGSLKGEAKDIQLQIETLIERMNESINEADGFIQSLLKS